MSVPKRIEEEAAKNGIFINRNKTRICKLSDKWRFLQIQYSLTDTGRIIKKMNPKRITNIRRKLRKLANILSKGEFDNYYKSWFKNNYKIMSKKQRKAMDKLFDELREGYYVQNCTC